MSKRRGSKVVRVRSTWLRWANGEPRYTGEVVRYLWCKVRSRNFKVLHGHTGPFVKAAGVKYCASCGESV